MQTKQAGFSVVILIALIVMVVGLVGWGVWRVYGERARQQVSQQDDVNAGEPVVPENELVSLLDGAIEFSLPTAWTKDTAEEHCEKPATGRVECLAGSILSPPEKLPTIYGNDYFSVNVSVYANANQNTAQEWYQKEYHGSLPTAGDEVSGESINGYDAYYFKQNTESYDHIYYVLAYNDKIVQVNARIIMKSYSAESSDYTDKRDFTKYTPEINAIVQSIIIN